MLNFIQPACEVAVLRDQSLNFQLINQVYVMAGRLGNCRASYLLALTTGGPLPL